MLFLFLFPPIGWFFRQGSRRAARRWPSIFGFQPCAGFASRTPALPSVRHHWLPAVSSSYSSSLPRLLSSSRVGPVRAGPGLGPAGPDADRSPHGEPARPAGGRDNGGRDQLPPAHPASRPARRPRSQAVENALRTCVRSACAYGRKPRSPQYGTAVLGCGVVSARRAGAPPAGPLTPPNLRTTRALESCMYCLCWCVLCVPVCIVTKQCAYCWYYWSIHTMHQIQSNTY